MALTKADKDYLEQWAENLIKDFVKPVSDKNIEQDGKITALKKTVEGEDGKNGMRKTVKFLERFAWMVSGALILLSSTVFAKIFHLF